MKKLLINSQFPDAVRTILIQLQLVEKDNTSYGSLLALFVDYPNDCLSQEMVFWLAMAQGCGLVESYQFGPVSSEARLAQTILSWIGCTRKDIESDDRLLGRTTISSRFSVLADSIEYICKETLKKG